MGVAIRSLEARHADEVLRIYKEGIEGRLATFVTEVPSWREWDAGHLPTCRLLAVDEGGVVGWAALTSVRGACAYTGLAEVSVYIADEARGRGIGRTLLEALVECSEKNGYWMLQAMIFPENEVSVRLHERLGFRRVGVRRRIAQLDGVWRDVVLLERRSERVGV